MFLVFSHTLVGHRLEYFHHLYEAAGCRINESFIFVYPSEEASLLSMMDWSKYSNVQLVELPGLNNSSMHLCLSIKINKVLRKLIKKYKPKVIILPNIMAHMPFLPIYVRKTKVRGIIYGIYLYSWKTDTIKKRIIHAINYFQFAYCNIFDKVYMQSDAAAARYLNGIFGSHHFAYLCDPVVKISTEGVCNLRRELNIPDDKIIILHPGDLSQRKGTLALLRGISICPKEVLDKYYFIFAGRLSSSIKREALSLMDDINTKNSNLKFISGFLSFEYLGSLIYTCDILFIPYLLTNQSSGIVSYSAEFKKPVVVTNNGLLAKIVKKYHLGYIISDSSDKTISDFFYFAREQKWKSLENSYLQDNSINNFTSVLFEKYV